jgi:hypothetical protein
MKAAAGAKTEMANLTALEPVSYMGPIAEDTTRGHLAIWTKVPRSNANKSGRPKGLNCRSLHCGPTARRDRRDGKGMGALHRDRRPVERTADPSTAVGMTKGRGGASIRSSCRLREPQIPAVGTTKGWVVALHQDRMLIERTADPSTSVGMTKEWVVALHQDSQTGPPPGLLARLWLASQRFQESN